MADRFTEYPDVAWAPNWSLTSGPEDRTPFITGIECGSVTAAGAGWILNITDPQRICTVRLFSNALSILARSKAKKNHVDVLLIEPGVLCGSIRGFSAPRLTAENVQTNGNVSWVQDGNETVLLLIENQQFMLVQKEGTFGQALLLAQSALDNAPGSLLEGIKTERKKTIGIFSINPRHNPPVAFASESLRSRLRSGTGSLPGLWSTAEGFPTETFSLNELYPLVQAWNIIDPEIALKLVQTVLSLQQTAGGFPAWISPNGITSSAAPWPFIIGSFEQVWNGDQDLIRQYLPALRKYIQWTLRHFDPYRDGIPSWQNEQEIFIPNSFERGKATPELTVMLIEEIEALLRLCEKSEHAGPTTSMLAEEKKRLEHTLRTVFWNPASHDFSNVWKNGHVVEEPSFGSFLPLLWKGLDKEKRSALINRFDETHGYPGQRDPDTWKQEKIDDTAHLPAIHQFMAFNVLQQAEDTHALLILFVRRAREGFCTWFDRENIHIARVIDHSKKDSAAPYALGPVTAALILSTQLAFQQELSSAPPLAKRILHRVHRARIERADIHIILVCLIALLLIHLLYNLPRHRDADERVAEAALNYQQKRFTEAMNLCRRYPNHPLSRLIQANMTLLAGRPDLAEDLYRKTLLEKPGSPSALFGLALALQMDGKFKDASKRYIDFLDIHQNTQPDAARLAEEFLQLSNEEFKKPPRWHRLYALPMMNDLGL